jgi:hypothetical protein
MANPLKDIPSSFGIRNANNLLLPAKGYNYFEDSERFPFNPSGQGHSRVNAWWLAECALLAYESQKNIETNLKKALPFDLSPITWIDNHSTGLDGFGVQGKDKDFAILSFRGTEFYPPEEILKDIGKLVTVGQDIIQDSKLWTDTFIGPPKFEVPVVKGFYQQLESDWPKLKSWIESLPQTRSLWLTGHSLGAAIALLLAYQFPDRVAGVYTFGCPCPGKQGFADAFNLLDLNDRTFRYVHGNDLIAKGLEFPLSSYRHVGTPMILEAASRKNLVERIWNRIIHRDITDHAPLYYALHCWNLIPESGA